jgi:lysophospholipase L1-like esterase
MSLRQRLSRVAVIPVAPVIFLQARQLRRETLRLPDPPKPWSGKVVGPSPLRLLVLGDSTVVGVGADSIDEALPGNLARELSARWTCGINYTAIGESGATADELLERYIDEATANEYDFIFLSVGCNDALQLRSRRAFGRDVRELLRRLRGASPTATILMSSLPAFNRFALFPKLLRKRLYLHSQSLEAEARAIVEKSGDIMSPPPPPYPDGFFSIDQFHPSAQGYHDWARFAIDDAFESGQLR